MEHSRQFAVLGSDTYVEAWTTKRLPFEPKGWLHEYRSELRSALRSLQATRGGILYAEYAAPDQGFADLENVLLYNLGSGCYKHLARQGIVCCKTMSPDELHRVRYRSIESSGVPAPIGRVLASARLTEVPPGFTPAHWWLAFRERLQLEGEVAAMHEGDFGIRVELGSTFSNRRVAPLVKALLDGVIGAVHVHDGSARDHVTAALSEIGDGNRLWNLLNDPGTAVLGPRRLVRPHGRRIAWNPADERCGFFAVTRATRSAALTASIHEMTSVPRR